MQAQEGTNNIKNAHSSVKRKTFLKKEEKKQ